MLSKFTTSIGVNRLEIAVNPTTSLNNTVMFSKIYLKEYMENRKFSYGISIQEEFFGRP